MFRYRFDKRTVKLAKILVLVVAADLVVFGLAPAVDESRATTGKPTAENQSVAPVFADPQPAKNPSTEISDGIGISRLLFGKIFRFLGTTASVGRVQGAGTCSPSLTGVRISA